MNHQTPVSPILLCHSTVANTYWCCREAQKRLLQTRHNFDTRVIDGYLAVYQWSRWDLHPGPNALRLRIVTCFCNLLVTPSNDCNF